VTTRQTFRILLVKPSKYAPNGDVERFRKGFMPNAALLHLRSMTPSALGGRPVVVDTIDEYTQTDLRYLDLLRPETCSLLAMVGVQSHQMHRALEGRRVFGIDRIGLPSSLRCPAPPTATFKAWRGRASDRREI
jgi:hypothetical protein